MTKDPAYYRALPYTKRVDREAYENDTYFVVRVEELPGCLAAGRTRSEALLIFEDAFDSYIEANLEWGHDIPSPNASEGPG